ncbi:hypothetical protein LCGC14_2501890 [marine sediment metagenome]|uniref:Uncharacterized protein n=1 Tax=marine sediment metagenome TaxID=412755 RepID=A0A0F9BPN9_9ZZZZ
MTKGNPYNGDDYSHTAWENGRNVGYHSRDDEVAELEDKIAAFGHLFKMNLRTLEKRAAATEVVRRAGL